jgi:hypothetical protein
MAEQSISEVGSDAVSMSAAEICANARALGSYLRDRSSEIEELANYRLRLPSGCGNQECSA